MIKAISQRTTYDCAYATIAMAANATYSEVAELVARRIYRPKMGLTTDEQLLLLHELTGNIWESYIAPPKQRLAGLTFSRVRDDDLSTYWKKGSYTYRHSLFCNGFRIFDPARHVWVPFTTLTRLPYYQKVFVSELLTEHGTFVQP